MSAMNQSEFAAITCNLLKAREKSHVQGTIRFDSRWGRDFLANHQSAAIAIVSFLSTVIWKLLCFRDLQDLLQFGAYIISSSKI